MENASLELCLIQSALSWERPEANFHHFESIIRHIHTADLILLPEMFSTGFTMDPRSCYDEPESHSLAWMREMARLSNSAISGSLVIKENDSFYNRLYFVMPDAQYYTYDKRHLFSLAGEEKVYTRGNSRLIVDYKGWRIMPFICYDLRFPVWCRNTEEVDLMFFVANWPERRAQAWTSLLRARAIENMCYVAGVNRIGEDQHGVRHRGDSIVFNELGDEILALEPNKQDIASVTLSKDELIRSRERFRFLADRDEFQIL